MAIVEPELVSEIIAQVAQEVILPRFRQLSADDIKEKHPGDLVTIADLESERVLTARLAQLLPGALVVGEEAVAADPNVLNVLQGDQPVWVIDPIDGTGNFVRGNERFGVIIALVQKRRVLQGWIHDPLRRLTVFAVRGEGTWREGERVRLAPGKGVLKGACAYRDRGRIERAGHVLRQLGSSAQEYLALLDGSLDFSCYHRLHPWDHAAGVLMHGEAGGVSGLLEGGDYIPVPQGGSLLMAPDRSSWSSLQSLFTAG
jgi:fructose-1,6-bisphosphatase/inositol monophosphatase family enzyme